MSGSKFRKGRFGVLRETIEDHLQALSAAGRDLVQRADFVFLPRVFAEIVESPVTVEYVLPVADHPEITKLRVNPTPFFKRILAATQAGGK